MVNIVVLGVFIAYVAVVIGLTIFARSRFEGDFQEEFFLSGRTLGSVVLAFTWVATISSSGTFIAHPGIGYTVGLVWVTAFAASQFILFFPMIALGKRVNLLSRRFEFITPIDILRARYDDSPTVIILSVFTLVLFYLGYIIGQLIAGAFLFQSVAGIGYLPALLVFATIIIFYTSYGGLRAVAWTDTLQGIVMIIGAVALAAMLFLKAGGISNVLYQVGQANPANLTPPGADEFAVPGIIVTFLIFWFASAGQPAQVIRLMSFKDSKSLINGMLLSAAIVAFWTILLVFLGTIGKAFIPEISNADQIIPELIIGNFPPIVAGILVAAPVAAIMSSADSYLHISVTALVRDLYMNFIDKNPSDDRIKFLVRVTGIGLGIIATIISISPPDILGIFIASSWAGLGIFTFVFLIGLYWPRANRYGAAASLGGGLLTYGLAYFVSGGVWTSVYNLHVGVFAIAAAFVLFILGSLVTSQPPTEIHQAFFESNPSYSAVEYVTGGRDRPTVTADGGISKENESIKNNHDEQS